MQESLYRFDLGIDVAFYLPRKRRSASRARLGLSERGAHVRNYRLRDLIRRKRAARTCMMSAPLAWRAHCRRAPSAPFAAAFLAVAEAASGFSHSSVLPRRIRNVRDKASDTH